VLSGDGETGSRSPELRRISDASGFIKATRPSCPGRLALLLHRTCLILGWVHIRSHNGHLTVSPVQPNRPIVSPT
jgi:hypothetical protein